MDDNGRVYLDYNATAPLRPEARAAILEALSLTGNASSAHSEGRTARKLVEQARDHVAILLAVKPSRIVFTSGASEANACILSAFPQDRILVGATEHSSVLEMAPNARRIPVRPNGVLDLNALENLLNADPAPLLISVMTVNNETGVLHPIADIAKMAHERGILVHTDAVQGAGRLDIRMDELGADYISLSGHKIGGPQGVGVLAIRADVPEPVLIKGGGQERRRRSGTENVAGISGLGAAAERAFFWTEESGKQRLLQERLETGLKALAPEIVIHGEDAPRAFHTTCFSLPGRPSATEIMALDLSGIALSNGSACSSGKVGTSHVLGAMGVPEDIAACAIRVSTGWASRNSDIDRFLEVLRKRVGG